MLAKVALLKNMMSQVSKTVKCTPEIPVQDLDVMPTDDENSISVVAILENGKKFGALMFVNELAGKEDEILKHDAESSDANVCAMRAPVCVVLENSSEEEEGVEKKYVKCVGRIGEEEVMEIKIVEEEVQRGSPIYKTQVKRYNIRTFPESDISKL